jgi:hypothetical protein
MFMVFRFKLAFEEPSLKKYISSKGNPGTSTASKQPKRSNIKLKVERERAFTWDSLGPRISPKTAWDLTVLQFDYGELFKVYTSYMLITYNIS